MVNGVMSKLNEPLKTQLKAINPKGHSTRTRMLRCIGCAVWVFIMRNYDYAIMEFMKAQDLDPSDDMGSYWLAGGS